jgi:hypothetical protein
MGSGALFRVFDSQGDSNFAEDGDLCFPDIRDKMNEELVLTLCVMALIARSVRMQVKNYVGNGYQVGLFTPEAAAVCGKRG